MTMSNGECSGDVIPGTGILANNILGEDDLHPDGFHAAPPGIRVSSMMSPTIVVGPTGATEVVVGSGGSKRIRSAVLQALLNVVVHGLDPRAAVEGARVHWDVDHVRGRARPRPRRPRRRPRPRPRTGDDGADATGRAEVARRAPAGEPLARAQRLLRRRPPGGPRRRRRRRPPPRRRQRHPLTRPPPFRLPPVPHPLPHPPTPVL